MHNACGKFVESLGKNLAQVWYNLVFYTAWFTCLHNKPVLMNIKLSVLYPEAAINAQPGFMVLQLRRVGFYTLYTGPTNTNNLIKGTL